MFKSPNDFSTRLSLHTVRPMRERTPLSLNAQKQIIYVYKMKIYGEQLANNEKARARPDTSAAEQTLIQRHTLTCTDAETTSTSFRLNVFSIIGRLKVIIFMNTAYSRYIHFLLVTIFYYDDRPESDARMKEKVASVYEKRKKKTIE